MARNRQGHHHLPLSTLFFHQINQKRFCFPHPLVSLWLTIEDKRAGPTRFSGLGFYANAIATFFVSSYKELESELDSWVTLDAAPNDQNRTKEDH